MIWNLLLSGITYIKSKYPRAMLFYLGSIFGKWFVSIMFAWVYLCEFNTWDYFSGLRFKKICACKIFSCKDNKQTKVLA